MTEAEMEWKCPVGERKRLYSLAAVYSSPAPSPISSSPTPLFLSFLVSHPQLSEVKTLASVPFPLHSRGEPLERGVLLLGLSFPSERPMVRLELWVQCQGFPSHREVHVPCEL